jgi:hypothetical protein
MSAAAELQAEHLMGSVSVSNNYTIRDSANPHVYKDTVPGSSDAVKAAGYHIWQNSGNTGFRPVIFKPNASFSALKVCPVSLLPTSLSMVFLLRLSSHLSACTTALLPTGPAQAWPVSRRGGRRGCYPRRC